MVVTIDSHSPAPIPDYGFTLIELAIVLVIIGLVTGSIMVGKDLIMMASIRSQARQIEQYETAVNTFREKYSGIPGDLAFNQAVQFSFFNTGMDGSLGRGDGNGLVQDTYGGQLGGPRPNGEVMVFWRHLSDAQLIDAAYGAGLTGTGINAGGVVTNITSDQSALYLPPSKMGRSSYLIPYSLNGVNFLQLTAQVAGANVIQAPGTAYGQLDGSITPLEAQSIDAKTDDGLPQSGRVQAMGYGNKYYGSPSTLGDWCVLAGSPVIYDTGSAHGNAVKCGLSFRFQ